jgi:hypothetical protein
VRSRADGTGPRHLSDPGLGSQTVVGEQFRRAAPSGQSGRRAMWDDKHTRKPTLLFRLFGLFLLRLAQRTLSW